MELEAREKLILEATERLLGARIIMSESPRQGMGSSVLAIRDDRGRDYVVKVGEDVGVDIAALGLIARNKARIPVPAIIGYFDLIGERALVMEKIPYPLMEDVSDETKQVYIIPMLEALDEIHKVKSDFAGSIDKNKKSQSWKKFLEYKYSGEHPWFDWGAIARRKGVDGRLITGLVATIKEEISSASLPEVGYSLLHTDFNQRNLFVDVENHKLAGIIDWSEAIYGDPIYDFCRVHMFMIHFELEDAVLETYFEKLALDSEGQAREKLYLKSLMLDYIAWYSEERNDFNDSRLRLHQDFLRNNF